jgi:pectate lyase
MYSLFTYCILIWLGITNATQLAFPGAEGFGRYATGGRAGSNYVVSSLADSGPGTLRDALSEPGRIVSFNVSGVIKIKKRIVVPKSTTILGQTAPGDGITVYGNGWSFSGASNSIVRYLRIRMGTQGDAKKDCMGVANGWNMVFDHISAYWGRDETFSINAPDKAGNITIQDCIIAQGLETHSAGGLMQCRGGISILRTLWADNKTRTPKVNGRNDFTNNVVYNWGSGGAYIAGGSAGHTQANIVGNYMIAGPNSKSTPAFSKGHENFTATVRNNYVDSNRDGVLNGKEVPMDSKSYGSFNLVNDRTFGFSPPSKIMTALDALQHVLANAGASNVRDAVDKQLIQQVESWGKQGKLISEESETVWGLQYGAKVKQPKENGQKNKRFINRDLHDSDGDGIPDWYEEQMGWDPRKNDALVIEKSGYSRLEEYANHLIQ